MYRLHTRTKTGRSKELGNAALALRIEISENDAAPLGIKEGDRFVI